MWQWASDRVALTRGSVQPRAPFPSQDPLVDHGWITGSIHDAKALNNCTGARFEATSDRPSQNQTMSRLSSRSCMADVAKINAHFGLTGNLSRLFICKADLQRGPDHAALACEALECLLPVSILDLAFSLGPEPKGQYQCSVCHHV